MVRLSPGRGVGRVGGLDDDLRIWQVIHSFGGYEQGAVLFYHVMGRNAEV